MSLSCINPCPAEFFLEKNKIYFHFTYDTETWQVAEIMLIKNIHNALKVSMLYEYHIY